LGAKFCHLAEKWGEGGVIGENGIKSSYFDEKNYTN
jgi:hypothetical protein